MLQNVELENILVFDIETVPGFSAYEEVPAPLQTLWQEKNAWSKKEEQTWEEHYQSNAGILAEFGKIVCIGAGFFKYEKDYQLTFRVKSYTDDDEKNLLTRFASLLSNYYDRDFHYLCGHNIKEFDIPFLCRRMLIHGIRLPSIINIQGAKPWEVRHIDTLQLWRFGDFKHYTSLNLLAYIFGIPSPKEDISGADVGRVYWEENDLPRIARYCVKDVITTAQLFLRLSGRQPIPDENIIYAE